MRLAALLTLLLGALAAESPAQPSERSRLLEDALRSLTSTELRDRAWGAYRASEHRLVGAVPLVRRNLGELPATDRDRGVAIARAAGLDALVRMNVAVPPAELLPHAFGEHVGAVLVLLTRVEPVPVEPLLEILDRQRDAPHHEGWLAAGNLLLARRAPGFAARVLGRLETVVDVQVRSDASYRGPFAVLCTDGRYRLPEDFPPLVCHALSLRKYGEETLLAPGVRGVYVRREERRNGGSFGFVTGDRDPDRNDYRAEWIDLILRRSGAEPPEGGLRRHRWWRLEPIECGTKLGPPGHPRVTIRWSGEPPFRRQLGFEIEAMHVTFWDSIRVLVKTGWLTPVEARRLMPRIRFRLHDQRSWHGSPLPEILPPPATNPWRAVPRPRGRDILVRRTRSISQDSHARKRLGLDPARPHPRRARVMV